MEPGPPVSRPGGCIARAFAAVAALGLAAVAVGLVMVAAIVLARPESGAHLPLVARLGFTVMILGLTVFVDAMCAVASARVSGWIGQALVFGLLWLPLGIPAAVAAVAGLVALWTAVP